MSMRGDRVGDDDKPGEALRRWLREATTVIGPLTSRHVLVLSGYSDETVEVVARHFASLDSPDGAPLIIAAEDAQSVRALDPVAMAEHGWITTADCDARVDAALRDAQDS